MLYIGNLSKKESWGSSMSTLYEFIPEQLARYVEGKGITIHIESRSEFNLVKNKVETEWRAIFYKKCSVSCYLLSDPKYLKATNDIRCEMLIDFLKAHTIELGLDEEDFEYLRTLSQKETKNNSEEGNNMNKILKFLEKNDIKYVRDNSVFPGKYDYLFFKSGSNNLIEFHNLSNDEISREDYQDIIIKKLEKAYVCKYYNY